MDEIVNLRKEVDDINRKIFELLEERFDLTNKIANLKARKNIKLEDLKREGEMLADLLDEFYHYEYKFAILEVFTKIIDESKRQQLIEVEKQNG